MNIIYLSSSRIPSRDANSINVMKMCQAFANTGHSVLLYAQRGNEEEISDYSYYDVSNCFSIKKFRRPNIRGLGMLIYSKKVMREIMSSKLPDVFYGRDTYSMFQARNIGIPMVLELHHRTKNLMINYMIKKIVMNKNFANLVVISMNLKDKYLEMLPFLDRDKIIVAYNGSDEPIRKRKIKAKGCFEHPCVGYIGHLYPGKGMEIIMQVAPLLPEVDFHVVGGTQAYIKYWRDKAIHKNIIFHGFVNQSMLSEYYDNIDIFLVPYQKTVKFGAKGMSEAGENMISLKIFEYMAYRKAIIASDFPSIREVLIDQKNSLLCHPEDASMWCEAIRLLISDEQLRNDIAEKAYHDFMDNYTRKKRAFRVLADIHPK